MKKKKGRRQRKFFVFNFDTKKERRTAAENIKKGDVFRVYEPDSRPFIADRYIWFVAVRDAKKFPKQKNRVIIDCFGVDFNKEEVYI